MCRQVGLLVKGRLQRCGKDAGRAPGGGAHPGQVPAESCCCSQAGWTEDGTGTGALPWAQLLGHQVRWAASPADSIRGSRGHPSPPDFLLPPPAWAPLRPNPPESGPMDPWRWSTPASLLGPRMGKEGRMDGEPRWLSRLSVHWLFGGGRHQPSWATTSLGILLRDSSTLSWSEEPHKHPALSPACPCLRCSARGSWCEVRPGVNCWCLQGPRAGPSILWVCAAGEAPNAPRVSGAFFPPPHFWTFPLQRNM